MKLQICFSFAFLLSRTTAAPLQSRDANAAISEALLSNFKLFANFTAASYCPANENATTSSRVMCPTGICPLVEADNVTSVVEFGGSPDVSLADIKGFMALDPIRSLIVVTFAGSGATIRNWLDDFTFIQVPYVRAGCTDCWIHSGFDIGWSERRAAVVSAVATAMTSNPTYELVITGHSIGAAIATLAGAELRSLNYSADIYTFGSPRVGNAAFAQFIDSQAPSSGSNYRMTHLNDPIPQLPPTWIGYQHTSPEYWLKDGTATTDKYGVEDVAVCLGMNGGEPTGCNSATGLIPIDGTAHSHYLGGIDSCAGPVAF